MSESKKLTQEQLDDYNNEEYLPYRKPMLPDKKFQALKQHFENLLSALKPGKRSELMDVPHFVDTALFEWLNL